MPNDFLIQKLDDIAENVLMFPLFFRNLVCDPGAKSGFMLINMEIRAVFMLSSSPALPTSEIGHRLGISKPNMSALLNRLVDKGLVMRMTDVNDRRVVRVEITEKGREWIGKKKRTLRSVIRKNISALSPTDIEALSAALETMKHIIAGVGSG